MTHISKIYRVIKFGYFTLTSLYVQLQILNLQFSRSLSSLSYGLVHSISRKAYFYFYFILELFLNILQRSLFKKKLAPDIYESKFWKKLLFIFHNKYGCLDRNFFILIWKLYSLMAYIVANKT
jgi:hypothetical protein